MGVFVKQGNQWVKMTNIEEGGSTNDNLLALGYDHNQFYSYTNYNLPYDWDENGDNIICVCLKVMSEDIICVITCPGRISLLDAEVDHYMQDFNFAQEYSLYSLESDLDSAIAEHNYSIEFVADALGISYSPDDTLLYSSRLKYNFIFENGYLVDYELADGYNREAHDLKNSSSWIYDVIESHAKNYHGSNGDAVINEINIQSQAFYNLPGGINNHFLSEFANADKSYNFKMLLVANYQDSEYEHGINYEDCKCICHNELKFEGNIEEGLDKLVKYRYRDYLLTFDDKGTLKSCEYNHVTRRSQSNPVSDTASQSSGSGSGCMLTLMSALCIMMSIVALFVILL